MPQRQQRTTQARDPLAYVPQTDPNVMQAYGDIMRHREERATESLNRLLEEESMVRQLPTVPGDRERYMDKFDEIRDEIHTTAQDRYGGDLALAGPEIARRLVRERGTWAQAKRDYEEWQRAVERAEEMKAQGLLGRTIDPETGEFVERDLTPLYEATAFDEDGKYVGLPRLDEMVYARGNHEEWIAQNISQALSERGGELHILDESKLPYHWQTRIKQGLRPEEVEQLFHTEHGEELVQSFLQNSPQAQKEFEGASFEQVRDYVKNIAKGQVTYQVQDDFIEDPSFSTAGTAGRGSRSDPWSEEARVLLGETVEAEVEEEALSDHNLMQDRFFDHKGQMKWTTDRTWTNVLDKLIGDPGLDWLGINPIRNIIENPYKAIDELRNMDPIRNERVLSDEGRDRIAQMAGYHDYADLERAVPDENERAAVVNPILDDILKENRRAMKHRDEDIKNTEDAREALKQLPTLSMRGVMGEIWKRQGLLDENPFEEAAAGVVGHAAKWGTDLILGSSILGLRMLRHRFEDVEPFPGLEETGAVVDEKNIANFFSEEAIEESFARGTHTKYAERYNDTKRHIENVRQFNPEKTRGKSDQEIIEMLRDEKVSLSSIVMGQAYMDPNHSDFIKTRITQDVGSRRFSLDRFKAPETNISELIRQGKLPEGITNETELAAVIKSSSSDIKYEHGTGLFLITIPDYTNIELTTAGDIDKGNSTREPGDIPLYFNIEDIDIGISQGLMSTVDLAQNYDDLFNKKKEMAEQQAQHYEGIVPEEEKGNWLLLNEQRGVDEGTGEPQSEFHFLNLNKFQRGYYQSGERVLETTPFIEKVVVDEGYNRSRVEEPVSFSIFATEMRQRIDDMLLHYLRDLNYDPDEEYL